MFHKIENRFFLSQNTLDFRESRASQEELKTTDERHSGQSENLQAQRVVEAARGKSEREREKDNDIASLSYFITFTRSLAAVQHGVATTFRRRRIVVDDINRRDSRAHADEWIVRCIIRRSSDSKSACLKAEEE